MPWMRMAATTRTVDVSLERDVSPWQGPREPIRRSRGPKGGPLSEIKSQTGARDKNFNCPGRSIGCSAGEAVACCLPLPLPLGAEVPSASESGLASCKSSGEMVWRFSWIGAARRADEKACSSAKVEENRPEAVRSSRMRDQAVRFRFKVIGEATLS